MSPPSSERRRLWALGRPSLLLSLAIVALQSSYAHAGGDADSAESNWARVLDTHVDAGGRIDFRGLKQDPAELERYVRWLASHGPRSTPQDYGTPTVALAYHLNAYNALAMRTVLRAGPPRVLDAWQRIKLFLLTPVRVDGDWTTLYSYENYVIRALGEPRVHFALNCMASGCPRLPRAPFRAERLERQLEDSTVEFLQDARNLQTDVATRELRLSEILSFYATDFVARDGSQIGFVNRHRLADERIPADFTIGFLPYDWTVNRQP